MKSRNMLRYLSAFLFGMVIIFPLLNQSGVISIYEALLGIWLVFLVPAYLGYRSMAKTGNRKAALILTAVIYIMGSALYSLIEPIIAGYNLGYIVFLIPVPASIIIMMPTIYIGYRSRTAKPKTGLVLDEPLTAWIRSKVENTDPNPPEVAMASRPRRVGANFASHTDGPQKKILLAQDARNIFGEDELHAAVLKTYYDMKANSSMKFIFRLNLILMLYVDAIILLTAFSKSITSSPFQLIFVLALAVVVFGFILSFPFIIRIMATRKDFFSDSKAAETLLDVESLKSYIKKAAENYIPSPMSTPTRQMKAKAYQQKIAGKRIARLENATYAP